MWMQEIKRYCHENVCTLLLGNKSDWEERRVIQLAVAKVHFSVVRGGCLLICTCVIFDLAT